LRNIRISSKRSERIDSRLRLTDYPEMKFQPRLFLAVAAILAVTAAFAADSAPHMNTKVCGSNELYCADVELLAGKRKLITDATVTVEQVFGQDPQGTSWFYFGSSLEDANGIGAAGDTVRVQIPAAVTPIGTTYPAVDVTYTILAGDVASSNPERTVAQAVCSSLNGNANFIDAKWKCEVAKDFSLVHISSRLYNEYGERTSWTVTCSGTTSCNRGFDSIKRRGKPTELSRSPNDPRQGVLAIAGSVTTTPGSIGDRFFEYAKNTPASSSLLVDCSPYVAGTCDWRVNAEADKRIQIEYFSCFGGGNGIKFGQFLSKSGAGGLTNGLFIEIRSQGQIFDFPLIKTTENWKNLFATQAGRDFRIDIQAGSDQFIAQFRPAVPFPLEPIGTVSGGDDYILVKSEDDISSGVSQLECAAFGFEQEP